MSSVPTQSLSVYGGARAATERAAPKVLEQLLDALATARDLGFDAWDFALDLAGLRAVGVTDSELRWAVASGFADHRCEVTTAAESSRSFRAAASLQLTEKSCFVLTLAGETYAKQQLPRVFPRPVSAEGDRERTLPISRVPEWDAGLRLLRIEGAIVKAYRVPAANQELILAAFQELGWPPVIDDPLPPRNGLDRKRRLHDTINSLNRNQRRPLLKFRGKGNGQGVCWELQQNSTRTPPVSV